MSWDPVKNIGTHLKIIKDEGILLVKILKSCVMLIGLPF